MASINLPPGEIPTMRYSDDLNGLFLLQRRIVTMNRARLNLRDDLSDRMLAYPEASRLTTLFSLGYIPSDVALRDLASLSLQGKEDLTSEEFFAVIEHNHELRTRSYEENLFPVLVPSLKDVLDKHLKVGYYTIVDNPNKTVLISKKRKRNGDIVYKVHYRVPTYSPALLKMDLDDWIIDTPDDFILFFRDSYKLKKDILGLMKGNLISAFMPPIQKRLVEFSKQEYSPKRKVSLKRKSPAKRKVSLKRKSPAKRKVSLKRKSPAKRKVSLKRKSPRPMRKC